MKTKGQFKKVMAGKITDFPLYYSNIYCFEFSAANIGYPGFKLSDF